MNTRPSHTCIDNEHLPCAACQADPKEYAAFLVEQEKKKWAPPYRYSLESALSPLEQDELRYTKRLQQWGDST